MKAFERTLEANGQFDAVVANVEGKAAEKGFRVLYTHDVASTLAEKGFAREPLKIVEICNARYASIVLEKDVRISLMLPCPISVYVQGGKTFISAMLPTAIGDFYPEAGIEDIAKEVEKAVIAIIEEAAR